MNILALALAFYRTPLNYQNLLHPERPLPTGVDDLLRFAAGSRQGLEEAAAAIAVDPDELRKACIFFIQRVFFVQGASHFRLLGLNRDAEPEQIKEHHRLLMRLFHPDRHSADATWVATYAHRINEAYGVLRKTDSREAYQAQLHEVGLSRRQTLRRTKALYRDVFGSREPTNDAEGIYLPSTFPRYLPQAVLGLAAVVAFSFVLHVYWTHSSTTGSLSIPLTDKNPSPLADDEPLAVTTAGPRLDKTSNDVDATTLTVPDLTESVSIPPPLPRDALLPQSSALDSASSPSMAEPETSASVPSSLGLASEETSDLSTTSTESSVALVADHRSPSLSSDSNEKISPRAAEGGENTTNVPSGNVAVDIADDDALISSLDAGQVPIPPSRPPTVSRDPPKPDTSIRPRNIAVVSETDLEVLSSLFIGAYERGDIDTLMSLFDDQARTNDQVGKASIRQEYETLFGATDRREMTLSAMQWNREGSQARGHGLFQVRIHGTREARNYAGTVRFEVEKKQGQVVINSFFHQDLYHKFE